MDSHWKLQRHSDPSIFSLFTQEISLASSIKSSFGLQFNPNITMNKNIFLPKQEAILALSIPSIGSHNLKIKFSYFLFV